MNARKTNRAALALLLSAGLLATLVLANVGAVASSRAPLDAGPAQLAERDGRALLYAYATVPPGSTVRIAQAAVHDAAQAAALHLYVVEAGDEAALLRGEAPERVYLHVAPGEARPDPDAYFTFQRPQPPPGRGIPGKGLGQYYFDAVAIAWVPDDSAPGGDGNGTGDAAAEALRAARGDGSLRGHAWVIDGRLLGLQPAFYAAEALAAVAVVASGAAWVRGNAREPPIPQGVRDTEALLRLIERAEGYLVSLRNFLLLVGVILALLALLGATAAQVAVDSLAPWWPSAGWGAAVRGGLVVAYLAIALAWLAYYLTVSHELKRWRERTQEPPIEL